MVSMLEEISMGRSAWESLAWACPACSAALEISQGGPYSLPKDFERDKHSDPLSILPPFPRGGVQGQIDGGRLEREGGPIQSKDRPILHCPGCDRNFPTVAGLPDLRLSSDRYLTLDAERSKAKRLAAIEPGTDLIGLASAYYAMTDDVDDRRRARYLRHIEGAEIRGAALAALLPTAGTILEVGCGTGGLLAAATATGRRIVGVDIALRWQVVARRRLADCALTTPLVGASADRLPWPDGSFDAVVADSLLEHLDDPGAALREWRRVIRPGGRLLVWGPNRFSITPDPHVGLWGLGWLPEFWASPYVRLRRGCGWPVRPLSAAKARRLAVEAGWSNVRVGPPTIPASWAELGPIQRRLGIRAYSRIRKRPLGRRALTAVGPLWQLEADHGEAS